MLGKTRNIVGGQVTTKGHGMPRKARLVVPGYAHHITQRGIRGLPTFFSDADYRSYLDLFRAQLMKSGLVVYAYCLMPNHVHVVAVPKDESGLSNHFRSLHSNYAKEVNASRGWKGHLWQERFYSVVMDELHTLAALRYVELNPVRAGLCDHPAQWVWSSARANLGIRYDGIVDTEATKSLVGDWGRYLDSGEDTALRDALRRHTRTGRPAGSERFLDELERMTGKPVRPKKKGPAPRS